MSHIFWQNIPISSLNPDSYRDVIAQAIPAFFASILKNESTPKTHKTKNVSFGDIFHFLNPLMLRHH